MVRIAVASHSLVAERQSWFWDYVGQKHPVLKLSPKNWGQFNVPWGYDVLARQQQMGAEQVASFVDYPDMNSYVFPQEALAALEKFEPDVIYVQNEADSEVATQLKRVAYRIGAKFVIFAWENMRRPSTPGRRNLVDADLVVCGNGEAEEIVRRFNKNTLRCIQVGVNTTLFKPHDEVLKEYDVVFSGRQVKEKGVEVLKLAVEGTGWKVLWPDFTNYSTLPFARYCPAKVHACPSIDTPTWREQNAPYANLEALACGLYVATSDTAAIKEALADCPGAYCARQGDPDALRGALRFLLDVTSDGLINEAGREWVVRNHGYEAVEKKLLEAFERL